MAKPAKKTNGVIKKLKNLNRRERRDRRALTAIKQGVGRVTRRAMASTSPQKLRDCFNALHPAHLALPRAVGEYAVVRTTQNILTARANMLFGTFRMSQFNALSGTQPWTDVCAVGGASADVPSAGTEAYFMQPLRTVGFDDCTLVPSALTVQIMNPNPVQTTSGIVYIGRYRTQPGFRGSGQRWDALMQNFISYNSPRLCAAAKLAFRGVQVNALPLNMSDLADFASVKRGGALSPFPFAWDGAGTPTTESLLENVGFSPIGVHNPDGINLQYLVTIEWRVRFDPTNPAQSAHSFHRPATENTWSRVMEAGTNLGHGVEDIASVVADTGMAVGDVLI